jgi:hypothetical protein
VYFQRIDDKVVHDLVEPNVVGVHPHRDRRNVDRVPVHGAAGVERRDAVRHGGRSIDRTACDPDLPRRHAAHVEKVVHQACDVAELPHDHTAGQGRAVALRRRRHVEDVGGGGNGPERIAQLVPEHGEELVFGAALGLDFLAAPLALGEMVPDFVLPASRTQPGLHGAEQRHHRNWTLEERHVAEPLEVRRHGGGRRPHAPHRHQYDDRHVRPARLRLDGVSEHSKGRRDQHLFGEQDHSGVMRDTGCHFRDLSADLGRDPDSGKRQRHHLGVARERSDDQNRLRPHRRPG